jgi:hypothetical protein
MTFGRDLPAAPPEDGVDLSAFALLRYRISANHDRIGGDHCVRKHLATH